MKRPIYYIKNLRFSIQKGFVVLFSWLINFLSNSIFAISFSVVALTIYRLGFPHNDTRDIFIQNTILNFQIILLFSFLIRFFILINKKAAIRIVLGEFTLMLILSVFLVEHFFFPNYFKQILTNWYQLFETIYLIGINSIIFLIEFSKKSLSFLKGINPSLLFLSSFILIILIGCLLLMLPSATTNGISITDAFFTSTSAVCVTGLTTIDTATSFTFFGKTIIMLLIQIGGLGIMTFTTFFGLFFSGSSSFSNQLIIKDLINSEAISEIFKTLIKIILFTLIIEGIGFLMIWFSLDPHMHFSTDNIKYSIFHSISAFCNAGFSTKSLGLMDPTTSNNYLLHTIIAFLIILGGIGFPILLNYYKLFKHFINNLARLLQGKSYSHKPHIININSRIVIITTLLLILFGMISFYVFEYNHALKNYSWYEKIYLSFFASVTPRTAGFNTIDYSQVFPITALLTMFLMWVGASPSGTGGGIKTSTFAIAILNIFSFAKGKGRIETSKREISSQSVRKAFATIQLSLLVIGIAITLVSYFNPELDFEKIIFECFSAFGTVGLSMGITPHLSVASKWVIIVTMFLGRVGTLTLFVAFIRKVTTVRYKYPIEEVIIN
ncbi:MAG TPA: potassium transporter TrkG [Bacteroidales bacterium]|mgnify:CR=1 FL=1|nr:potassium transporter TrkG [Bacteroidales bacterium]HOU97460.1 potassium transporter TrkG [Bacteroidales bacterium]